MLSEDLTMATIEDGWVRARMTLAAWQMIGDAFRRFDNSGT